jgi:hypothetical protein
VSYRRLDTLLDIAKQGYWLKLTCRCGRQVRVDPMKVLERLLRRGADVRLSHLRDALKCGRCGGKTFTAAHCRGPGVWS